MNVLAVDQIWNYGQRCFLICGVTPTAVEYITLTRSLRHGRGAYDHGVTQTAIDFQAMCAKEDGGLVGWLIGDDILLKGSVWQDRKDGEHATVETVVGDLVTLSFYDSCYSCTYSSLIKSYTCVSGKGRFMDSAPFCYQLDRTPPTEYAGIDPGDPRGDYTAISTVSVGPKTRMTRFDVTPAKNHIWLIGKQYYVVVGCLNPQPGTTLVTYSRLQETMPTEAESVTSIEEFKRSCEKWGGGFVGWMLPDGQVVRLHSSWCFAHDKTCVVTARIDYDHTELILADNGVGVRSVPYDTVSFEAAFIPKSSSDMCHIKRLLRIAASDREIVYPGLNEREIKYDNELMHAMLKERERGEYTNLKNEAKSVSFGHYMDALEHKFIRLPTDMSWPKEYTRTAKQEVEELLEKDRAPFALARKAAVMSLFENGAYVSTHRAQKAIDACLAYEAQRPAYGNVTAPTDEMLQVYERVRSMC